jgi:hypothetical protein
MASAGLAGPTLPRHSVFDGFGECHAARAAFECLQFRKPADAGCDACELHRPAAARTMGCVGGRGIHVNLIIGPAGFALMCVKCAQRSSVLRYEMTSAICPGSS